MPLGPEQPPLSLRIGRLHGPCQFDKALLLPFPLFRGHCLAVPRVGDPHRLGGVERRSGRMRGNVSCRYRLTGRAGGEASGAALVSLAGGGVG